MYWLTHLVCSDRALGTASPELKRNHQTPSAPFLSVLLRLVLTLLKVRSSSYGNSGQCPFSLSPLERNTLSSQESSKSCDLKLTGLTWARCHSCSVAVAMGMQCSDEAKSHAQLQRQDRPWKDMNFRRKEWFLKENKCLVFGGKSGGVGGKEKTT